LAAAAAAEASRLYTNMRQIRQRVNWTDERREKKSLDDKRWYDNMTDEQREKRRLNEKRHAAVRRARRRGSAIRR
jgi:hypothetical protein